LRPGGHSPGARPGPGTRGRPEIQAAIILAMVGKDETTIDILQEIIQLLSRDSLLSPKSSARIEKFLIPRFDEIMGIIYTNKTLPPEIGIEISKESLKDIIKGIDFAGVISKLDDRGISSDELKKILEKVKFSK
ncbi:MAG: hypothetical protein ACFFBK_08900, partial [Promethearchaeota archaeon]